MSYALKVWVKFGKEKIEQDEVEDYGKGINTKHFYSVFIHGKF